MVKDGVEVEIKIPVSRKVFEKVKKFCKKNAKFVSTSSEIDKYFNPPHRSFLKKAHPTEYLRVRVKESGGSITYKNVYMNTKGERTHSTEYESKLENPDQVEKILDVLNFNNFITIDKNREEYIYRRVFEIDLDKVRGLGYFVEIESVANKGGIEKTVKRVREFARKLGLDPDRQDKKGYVLRMIEKKGLR